MQAEGRIYGTQESSALSVRRDSGSIPVQWMFRKMSDPVTVTVWTYYNGDQLDTFKDLTEKFNDTVGKKDGITVETKSLGTAEDLEQNVLAAADGEVGASEVPNIFSAYSDTAYTMDQKDMLVDLSGYLTDKEKSEYVEEYLKEGDFSDDGSKMF